MWEAPDKNCYFNMQRNHGQLACISTPKQPDPWIVPYALHNYGINSLCKLATETCLKEITT